MYNTYVIQCDIYVQYILYNNTVLYNNIIIYVLHTIIK